MLAGGGSTRARSPCWKDIRADASRKYLYARESFGHLLERMYREGITKKGHRFRPHEKAARGKQKEARRINLTRVGLFVSRVNFTPSVRYNAKLGERST